VVQRIPVKIALNRDSNALIELRPGMSVVPTIETHASAPERKPVAESKLSATVSGGSCHVKSSPVSLDNRAPLRQQI
jgi:membrane fusion protein (multidrug efflux system)